MKLRLAYDEDITDLLIENSNTVRSTTNVTEDDGKSIIVIDAIDPVAMRAAINGILKTIIVYEKTRKVIK